MHHPAIFIQITAHDFKLDYLFTSQLHSSASAHIVAAKSEAQAGALQGQDLTSSYSAAFNPVQVHKWCLLCRHAQRLHHCHGEGGLCRQGREALREACRHDRWIPQPKNCITAVHHLQGHVLLPDPILYCV